MGMATLAEWTQSEDAPDALARAHDLAAAGEVAHPESVGGRLCAHLRASIEAPGYDLTTMASDGPDRRSLAVEHQNLGRLYFRAYRVDFAARLASAREGNALLPRASTCRPSSPAGPPPSGRWSCRPLRTTSGTGPTSPRRSPGPASTSSSPRSAPTSPRTTTDARRWTSSSATWCWPASERAPTTRWPSAPGAPAGRWPGCRSSSGPTSANGGQRRVAVQTSGADGRVRFAADWPRGEGRFVVAQRGDEVAIDAQYHPRLEADEPSERTAALVYTDRTVYRPAQTLYWKAVVYHEQRR